MAATDGQSIDDLGDAYTAALIGAQMERTPAAWAAVGLAWDAYFDALIASDSEAYRDRKMALAEKTGRHLKAESAP